MAVMNNVYNIVNKVLNKNNNVLYEPKYASFDATMSLLDINIISVNSPIKNISCFDSILINDWQKHASNRNMTLTENQLIDIVMFHSKCPPQFKKEDRFLLQNSFKNAYKIFLTQDIYRSWRLFDDNKSFCIPYGVPVYEYDESLKNDILVINDQQDSEINHLFSMIKNIFPNTKLITNNNSNTIVENIKQARVIIDMNNLYNILLGISAGCFTITNKSFDSNLQSTIVIRTVTEIVNYLHEIMNGTKTYQNKLLIDQSYIRKEYSLENFVTKMTEITNRAKLEPFVL